MEVVHQRCCGLDVHKDSVTAYLVVPGSKAAPSKEIRSFGTTTGDLREMAQWLGEAGCTHVAMESTGVYWKPLVRHEALSIREGMESPSGRPSQRSLEAEGSLTLETQGKVGAALTTTERVGTARRLGSGKRDGKVYECRNQRSNPLKSRTGSNLVDMGRIAAHVQVTA